MYEALSDHLLTELEMSKRKERPQRRSPSRIRNECSVHMNSDIRCLGGFHCYRSNEMQARLDEIATTREKLIIVLNALPLSPISVAG